MNRAAELVDDIRSNVVERLDYLMLTHLHTDCFSVMFRVLEARPGERILENEYNHPRDGQIT